jgi:phosphoesterase RecJ-like protein
MDSLESACDHVVFIDHHPILREGPPPTSGSVIDVSAASTGEMAYRLLLALDVKMTADIARALYTAVVFDTQMFRYVKSDPRSHLMAAELLKFELEPEAVHRALFATYTINKMNFFAKALSSVEYFSDGKIALLRLSSAEARESGLDPDESADVIDLVMNIESVEIGALVREDGPHAFKISLRSKSNAEVLPLAESFGGGGHPFASGAYVQSDGATLRKTLLDRMSDLVGSQLSTEKLRPSDG